MIVCRAIHPFHFTRRLLLFLLLLFSLLVLQRGELRRVLPDWHPPSIAAWAVFPGRRLMPAKTRAFLDMLQAALGDERHG